MLSPTRSAAQTVLKAVVTTATTVLQESTSVEQKEESNDADDTEPLKKKFKDDTEVEVRIERKFCESFFSFFSRSKLRLQQLKFDNDHQRNEKLVFHSVIVVCIVSN
jgi:hypothetical protein